MPKRIYFMKEWKKLTLKLFPTVRLDKGTTYYQTHNQLEVWLGSRRNPIKMLFLTEIVGIEHTRLRYLSDEFCMLDADRTALKMWRLMGKIYGKYEHWNGPDTRIIILFLMKISDKIQPDLKKNGQISMSQFLTPPVM